MVRTVGEGRGPSEVEEEEDEGIGEGDGEVEGSSKASLSPSPRMGCTLLSGDGGRRFEPAPPGKGGDACLLGLAVLPGYKPVCPAPTPPPHLEALALETSEPR